MWGSIGSMGQHEETLQRAQAVWGIMGQHVAIGLAQPTVGLAQQVVRLAQLAVGLAQLAI